MPRWSFAYAGPRRSFVFLTSLVSSWKSAYADSKRPASKGTRPSLAFAAAFRVVVHARDRQRALGERRRGVALVRRVEVRERRREIAPRAFAVVRGEEQRGELRRARAVDVAVAAGLRFERRRECRVVLTAQ